MRRDAGFDGGGVMIKHFTIGGSEIGAILGLNKYQGPMDIYCRKLGIVGDPPENEMMAWGMAAEHVVARRYQKKTGAILLPGVDEGYDYKNPMIHPLYPWWTGTPDRLIEPDGVLEIKIVGERMAHQFGEPPDGEVPEAYLIQGHWYLGLTDRKWFDLAVQIGNRDFRIYRFGRDEELLESLRSAAEAFINDHLIPSNPPPIDESAASKRYLDTIYPKNQGGMIQASGDAEHWAEQLLLAKTQITHWESIKDLNENLLKNAIGDNEGIEAGRWKVTWKKSKDTTKTDWEKLAWSLSPSPDQVDQFTVTKPGTRRFYPNLKGLEEDLNG